MGILNRLIFRPRKINAARKYFTERFGSTFFMQPAYCADCDKKPIFNEATAQEVERINRTIYYLLDNGVVPGVSRLEVGSQIPSCPECNWVMDFSSWDRFMVGFLGGYLTVDEFENMERKTYSNGNFVAETLNHNS